MLGALVGGALLGSALSGGGSEPKAPQKMSYDEALKQAEDALRQPYQDNREQVISDINRNMVSKGFYGQAPGDYLKQDAMTDMENDYQTQKSRYAQNLRNSNYAEAYQQYTHELQQYNQPDPFWSMLGTMSGSFLGSPGGSNMIANWLTG
jgi:hypothetical protein